MGLLNSLGYFLRRNWLIFSFLFIGALALGQAFYDQINVDNLRLDGNTISSQNTNGDINLDPNGSGGVAFPDLTATTVPYLDSNKELVSSSVTPTELGYISGLSSAIQTQIDGKLGTSLQSGYIFVGDGSNSATANEMSGDATLDNSGVLEIEAGVIENADVNASAGIEMSKLEALTASRALVSDGSGFVSAATTTATEIGYVNGVTSSLCGINQSCTQTNKTFTEPTIDAIIAEGLTATPSNPSGGYLKLYAKDDNKVYKLDSSGVETEIGAGGGGSGTGSINYFQDYQADDQGTYVAEFDDTSAITTGSGTASGNLTTASETSNPLSGSTSYKLTKPASTSTYEGWALDTDTPDRTSTVGGETVYITFNYETSANYDNDSSGEQVSIYVYRVGSNTLESCNTRDVLSGTFTNALPVAPDGGQYQCTTTLSSSDTSVRVIFGITGTGTSTWDLVVDKIKVGPDAAVTAPIVTEWQEYDVNIQGSGSNPTKATTTVLDQGYWRRNGDSIDFSYIYVHTDNTGAAAGSGTYSFNLPSQCTVDTTKVKITGAGGLSQVGTAVHFGTTSSTNATGVVSLSTTSRVIVIVGNAAAGDNSLGSSTYPLNDASWYVTIRGTVPCEEYGNSNAILSTTQQDHRNIFGIMNIDGSADSHTTSGNFEKVNFDNSSYDTHNITDLTNERLTAPIGADYEVCASIQFAANATGARGFRIYTNGSYVGAGWANIQAGPATDPTFVSDCFRVTLSQGDYLELYGYQSSGGALDMQADFTRFSLEVKPKTGSTYSVYGPYEYTEAQCTADTAHTNASTYYDATGASLSLTPGTWQICYDTQLWIDWVSTSVGSVCQTSIRNGSGSVIDGSRKLLYQILTDGNSDFVENMSSCVEVTTTDTTTYKLSFECSAASTIFVGTLLCESSFSGAITNPDAESKIWARRMK